ncbi:protein sprint isoform X2 [Folsomia candida]|uniref:protein sprint isoform X2 n=1 Tax=Folsomia candida TaxID=158441 RepID=UPI0016051C11|nr:protein sprint isoform X2 [Folsomia candida]
MHSSYNLKKLIMSDCVPSPESDSSYASSSESGPSSNSSSPTCEISLLERLIRTHPVWFLPSLQRSGALHLLQGRNVGNFLVRSCTLPRTMAISVKLPSHVEHYLLKANGNKISLENSTHDFETVHQLIAHYCGDTSDEIPVCLRLPEIISDATSRQKLASLALLGQEFWSLPAGSSSAGLKDSPTDPTSHPSLVQSSLGSQSSSSHSLCDLSKKPCRPTTLTLELGKCSGGGGSATPNPPPVPLRWSRSALLSPLSPPSSLQSTPSADIQSTTSDRSGRTGRKKKKRNSGGGNKAESIHYKDTEILALDIFKGTKTVVRDKESDYEDLWSPQQQQQPHERSHTPKLSTFKPDLIPSVLTPMDDDDNNVNHSSSRSSSKINSNQSKFKDNAGDEFVIQNMNIHNHRLSFNVQNLNLTSCSRSSESNISRSQYLTLGDDTANDGNRKSPGLYSEPVDSITLRKLNGNRNTEPNIRWSQPTLSLLKLDFSSNGGDTTSRDDYCPSNNMTGSGGQGKPNIMDPGLTKTTQHSESKNLINIGQTAINTTQLSGCADVSLANKSMNQMRARKSSSTKSSRKTQVTCASVDNLCHTNFKKTQLKPQMINRVEGDNVENATSSQPVTADERKDGSKNFSIINTCYEPIPGMRAAGTPEMTPSMEIPNTKAWCLDNSWELVMWQKEEERRLKENVSKFPVIPSPTNVRRNKTTPSESSHENSTSSTNNNSTNETYNSLQRRFSCYDNLERSKAEINADEVTDSDEEDKISPPWNSKKWDHLMRIISESTQQLDLLSSVGNTVHSSSNNASLHENETFRPSRSPNISDPVLQVTRMLEVGRNVDKAGKSVKKVVKQLATTDDGVFGPTIKSFISCTIAAKVQDPFKVMRNVRQFFSGMKNYLVGISNSESEELRKEIKKQTETLSHSEFLNIDSILEDCLVDLVISPLNLHIRGLIEAYNAKNGEPLHLPSTPDIAQFDKEHQIIYAKLRIIYSGFEDSISPLEKLDKWNEFVCQVQELDNYSSDSFLPLLSQTMGNVCSANLPSHVDYMIGLLPTALAEQNNYSLSMLQSAVSSLKVNKSDARKGSLSLTSVRVLIPDERNGTLIRKMVPVRNSTTNKEVAKILASKLSITNPTDYVLVTIKNGEETICPESELVYNCVDGGSTALAYKRYGCQIGWPKIN